jgi:hypothetical protein
VAASEQRVAALDPTAELGGQNFASQRGKGNACAKNDIFYSVNGQVQLPVAARQARGRAKLRRAPGTTKNRSAATQS